MKKSTKVIVSSVLSMALCASLIAGSTFALFSSEADVNVAITAGSVAVEATVSDLKGFSAEWKSETGTYGDKYFEAADTGVFSNGGKWNYLNGNLSLEELSPGDGVEFNLNFTNTSTIAIKYRIQLTVPESAGKLLSGLTVKFGDSDAVQLGTTTVATKWSSTVDPKGDIATTSVRIAFPITNENQNEYQGASCSFAVGVYAVQANAHVVDPEGALVIYSANDLYAFAASVNGGNTYKDQIVSLANDIYLSKTSAISTVSYTLADVSPTAVLDKPWTPIGGAENAFMGTFDGHGCTIYGLKAEGSDVALFGKTQNAAIQNVTIASADITATSGSAGTLVAVAEGELTVSNVTVKDSTVKKAEDATEATVGALVGKSTAVKGTEGVEETEAKVTVSDVDVNMNESDSELGGGEHVLVGESTGTVSGTTEVVLEPATGFVEKYTMENGKKVGSSAYEISAAEGLKYFAKTVNGTTDEGVAAKTYAGETVVLTKDIDLRNEPWTPIGTVTNAFKGTFDGQGYTISNLKIVAGNDPKTLNKTQTGSINRNDEGVGLFGNMLGGEGKPSVIKNFTLKNVDIEAPLVYGVGAVVGKGGTHNAIESVTVTGKIKIRGYQWVGGIAGHAQANIKNCKVISTADIKDTTYGVFANHQLGGIVGNASAGFELSGNTVKDIRLYAEDTVLGDTNGTGWEGHGGVSAKGIAGGIAGILAEDSGSAPTVKNNILENVIIDVIEVDESYYPETTSNPQYHGQGYDNILLYPGLTGALVGNGCGVYENNSGSVSIATPYNIPLAMKQNYAEGGLVGGISSRTGVPKAFVSTDNTIRVLWNGILLKTDGWHIENLAMLEAFRDFVNGGEVKSSFNNGTKVADDKADYKYLWMNHDFAGETVHLDGNIDLGSVDWSPIGNVEVMRAARTARGTALSNSSYKFYNEDSTYTGPKRFESDIAFKGTFDGAKTTTEDGTVTDVYTISNLTIENESLECAGLFGKIVNGTLKNLHIKNVNIHAHGLAGAAVGSVVEQGSRLENITVTNVTIKGVSELGGLVGNFYQGNGENLTVEGDVKITGNYKLGGLAGTFAYGPSATNFAVNANEGSYVNATYSAGGLEGDSVGGVIGFSAESNNTDYDNMSVSNISVSGTRVVGGIIGRLHTNKTLKNVTMNNVTVSNLDTPADYAEANRAKLNVGGVVGEALTNATIIVDGGRLTNVKVNVLYTYANPGEPILLVTGGEFVPAQILGAVRSGNTNVTLTLSGSFDGVTVTVQNNA